MAIQIEDLIVLTVAVILKHGQKESMSMELDTVREANSLISASDGHIRLGFIPMVDGESLTVHALVGKERISEWERMGLGVTKMGRA